MVPEASVFSRVLFVFSMYGLDPICSFSLIYTEVKEELCFGNF